MEWEMLILMIEIGLLGRWRGTRGEVEIKGGGRGGELEISKKKMIKKRPVTRGNML